MQDDTLQPETERTTTTTVVATPVMDGAMRTGEGADDEPEMTLGDRYSEDGGDDDAPPLTVEEAERLLPVDEADDGTPGSAAARRP